MTADAASLYKSKIYNFQSDLFFLILLATKRAAPTGPPKTTVIALPTFVSVANFLTFFAARHSALHLRGAGVASGDSMRKRLATRANRIDVNFILIDMRCNRCY
jgi:hypothetical protein